MSEWNPVIAELVTLLTIGLSGIGVGLALGWRHPLLLAAGAVAASTVVRVVTTLSMWSIEEYDLIQEAWWLASGALAAIGVGLIVLRHRRPGGVGLLIFTGLALASVATKYVLQMGERHHRDSVSAVETALLLFQGELDPTVWIPEEKRGLAYPLMLALGPDERLLSSLTPLVFLSVLAGVVWLGRELTSETVPTRWFILSVAIVGAFSLTVPIFRVALTYLNAHLLMTLGVLLMVAGGILAANGGRMTVPSSGLIAVGTVIATTSRVEAIVTVGALLAWLVSMRWIATWNDRLLLFIPTALSGNVLAWWLGASGSAVPESFGLSPLAVGGLTLIGAVVVLLPLVDPIRRFFFPIVLVGVVVGLARNLLLAEDFTGELTAQFNNVVLGYGGWGVAASAFGASLVVLGWRARSASYQTLVVLSISLIFATLFSKLFEFGGLLGGFGRDGFYDSVNRMWLHTLGVVAVTMVVGIGELIRDLADRLGRRTPNSPASPDYTSTTVSPSKDPVS